MDKLVNLVEYNNSLEAAEITALLDEEGIAYILDTKDIVSTGLSDSVIVKIYSSDMEEAELLLAELRQHNNTADIPSRYGNNAFTKDNADDEFNNRFQYTFERYHPTDHNSADPENNHTSNYTYTSKEKSHSEETTEAQQSNQDSKPKVEDVLKKYIARPIIIYIIIKIIFALLK